MRRAFFGLSVVGIGVIVASLLRPPGSWAQPATTTLPGARPTIEAIRYASLQAAIDALPPEGGMIRLPAGTFEISSPLHITQEDVAFEGSGTATHIKNTSEDGTPALVVQPKGYKTDHKAMQWRVRIANLRITGNPKSGHGIEATNVNEIFIDGVSVSYNGGDGIHCNNCYEDPRICNSLITYNKKTGLNLIACHDIVVAANHFEENLDALRCIDSFNLCMTGNNLDDHLRDGVVIENTYGSVVSGNMIEECAGTGIVLDRDCYGITLSANVIAHETSGGIDLRDAHGCTVSANTFTIVQKNALLIGPASSRITVTGNNFSDSAIGGGKVSREANDIAATGLVLNGATDVAISGNVFSGVTPKALTITSDATRRILFGDNVLADVKSDHARLRDSVVTDNLESAPAR
jgi:hypothetical protein